MSMPIQPPVWHHRSIPPGATRDEEGYIIEPPDTSDTSTWFGRRMKELGEGNKLQAEAQRALGFQVYPGEPGKPPEQMNFYQQAQVSRNFEKLSCGECNII